MSRWKIISTTTTAVFCLALAIAAAVESMDDSTTIVLEDFAAPTHEWTTMNDPVMGGKSYSSLEIDKDDGIAHFTGKCAIVPSLKAPGFITMVTGGSMPFSKVSHFRDVSACDGLQLELKTATPNYDGYRISFGKAHPIGNRYAFGYKTKLDLDDNSIDFVNVSLPFTSFSSKWDDATGDIIVECTPDDNPKYCPTIKWLQDMQTLSIWAEGVEGDIDLSIKRILAYGCKSDSDGGRPQKPYRNNMAISIVFVGSFLLGVAHQRRRRREARPGQQSRKIRGSSSSAPYQEVPDTELLQAGSSTATLEL